MWQRSKQGPEHFWLGRVCAAGILERPGGADEPGFECSAKATGLNAWQGRLLQDRSKGILKARGQLNRCGLRTHPCQPCSLITLRMFRAFLVCTCA